MDEELKKKAADAFKASADVAKKLGGIACDLSKKGYEAAKEKAKELGEKAKEAKDRAAAKREEERRIYAEQVKEAEQLAARRLQDNPEYAAGNSQTWKSGSRWHGDPADKSFLMSYGWLYFIWWLFNIIDSILCMAWIASLADSYYGRKMVWIPLLVWPLSLLFNRLAYEGAVALFEMVRHLRQIRDELRWHNMREEKKVSKELSGEQQCEAPAKDVPQDAGEAQQPDSTAI